MLRLALHPAERSMSGQQHHGQEHPPNRHRGVVDADAEIEASSFRTIWRVLHALAAHDARAVGRITEPCTGRSQGTQHTTTTKASERESTKTGEGEQPSVPEPSIEWLRMHAIAAVCFTGHGHLDPTDKTKHAELIS